MVNTRRPLVSEDSPLRRLPATLPRRVILHLDGLRLCAEIIDLAYERLLTILRELCYQKLPLTGRQISVMSDAWVIIDATHRFRLVLAGTPGLKHNHVYELFMRSTATVEELRHVIQHLDNEVDRIAEGRQAVLGTLSWLAASPTPDAPPSAYALTVGSEYPDKITVGPMMDLWSTLPPDAIEQIEIALGMHKVDLSNVVGRVGTMIQSLVTPVAEYAEGKPALGSDRLMHFELRPVEHDSPDSGTHNRLAESE